MCPERVLATLTVLLDSWNRDKTTETSHICWGNVQWCKGFIRVWCMNVPGHWCCKGCCILCVHWVHHQCLWHRYFLRSQWKSLFQLVWAREKYESKGKKREVNNLNAPLWLLHQHISVTIFMWLLLHPINTEKKNRNGKMFQSAAVWQLMLE